MVRELDPDTLVSLNEREPLGSGNRKARTVKYKYICLTDRDLSIYPKQIQVNDSIWVDRMKV